MRWIAPHGSWDDRIAFIFDGGTLDSVEELRPHDQELSESRFVRLGKVCGLVHGRMRW